jgi:alpha-1,2-mannosyltransferase
VRKAVFAGLVVLNAAVAGYFLVSFKHGLKARLYRIDLDVYRLGANVWRHGGELYGRLPALHVGGHLPFTYPPIAAILLVPLAMPPFGIATTALTLATIGALAFVLVVTLRALDVRPHPLLVWAVLPVALVLEPVRSAIEYGQIDVLLLALVLPDCLVRTPRWPRGALVGIAAAVKLTPALFVLFFLLRGEKKAALTAAVSFGCATAVGFLLAGRDSLMFWTSTVFDTRRIGGVTFNSNQSIKALLVRLGLTPGPLWALLAVALLGVAALGMRRAFAAGRPTRALGLNAFGALPASPISWSHHWVWIVPILLTAGVTAWRARSRRALALVAGGALLFFLSPHWWFGSHDPWTVWRLLLGDTYLFAAVAVVLVAGLGRVAVPTPVDVTASGPGRPARSTRRATRTSPPARRGRLLPGATGEST